VHDGFDLVLGEHTGNSRTVQQVGLDERRVSHRRAMSLGEIVNDQHIMA
jgi:hypothetical protein